MRATRAIGPVLGASLVLLAGACGEDGAPTADDPASETATSEAPGTPEPVEAIDFGTEPEVRSSYKKAALRAVDDKLITMVPSTLPDGWQTVGGGYQRDPQWWRMEFTAPSGEVTLDQLPGSTKDLLADQEGLAAGDDVDLTDWGTGDWSAWDHDGASVLAYDLKGSAVILQGPDTETLRGLAESLLPAEDAGEQEG